VERRQRSVDCLRRIDEAEVARVLAEDPYVTEGVSGERTVRRWQPILGGTITVG
jgi:uncharacterized protein YciI